MKNEIKKYLKNMEALKEEENKKEELNNKYINNYDLINRLKEENKTPEEIKKEIQKNQEQHDFINSELSKINYNITVFKIESDLIYNNICYLFNVEYNKIIIETLKKYQNKNIGPATKEKIQEELKNQIKICDYIYFNLSYNGFSYELATLQVEIKINDKHYQNIKILYNFNEDQKNNIKYYELNAKSNNSDYRLLYCSNENFDRVNYEYIKNTYSEAKKTYNQVIKNRQKFEELKKELTKIKNNNNSLINALYLNTCNDSNLEMSHNITLY